MQEKATLKRYGIFLVGVLICAMGIAFLSRSALGTSPLSSVSFVLYLATDVSAGLYTFACNMLFLAVDVILTRRFGWMQWLQIPATFVFSLCIDLWLAVIPTQLNGPLSLKVLYLILGCPIMALGITLEVLANVTILPGEGIVKTLSAKGGWEFGNVKVAFDCTLTAIASVIAFITFGRLNGVGIGTLVSALAVGQLVKLYSRCIKRSAARRAGGGAVQ